MPTTPVYALPYPGLDDTADVPRDMQALAVKLDGLALIPTFVSALPAGVDGQEVYYQNAAMATDGIAWHLRYRAASASAYKWEFVGGGALYNAQEAALVWSGTPSNWNDLSASPGPLVTLPLAGDYDAQWGCQVSPVQNQSAALMGIGYGAAWTTALGQVDHQVNVFTGSASNVARGMRITGAAAAAQLRARYLSNGGAHTFGSRYLSVVPVRLG